jgi:thioredoxin 1
MPSASSRPRGTPRCRKHIEAPAVEPNEDFTKGTDEVALIGEVTDQDFEERVLKAGGPVLVDFWAEWCVPCHMVSPVVEEIGRDKGEALQVATLNIDENPEVTRKYGVMSIPTLMLFKDGAEAARVIGARGKDALLKELDPHLAA